MSLGELRVVNDFAQVGIMIAFFASLIFIVGYTAVAPWWRYLAGRAIVSIDVALALALFPNALFRIFHVNIATLFFAWYEVITLFLISGITLWRLWVIINIQRRSLNHKQLHTTSYDPDPDHDPNGETKETVDS